MLYTIVDKLDQTITLDCVTSADESYSATVVEHAVETGSPVSDHVYIQNTKLSLAGIVSDFNFFNPLKGVYGATAFFDTDGNLVSNIERINVQEGVRNSLLRIFKNRELCSLVVGSKPNEKLVTHSNLIINSLSFPDNPDNGEAMSVNIGFTQLRTTSIVTKSFKKVPQALKIATEGGEKNEVSAKPVTAEGKQGDATIPKADDSKAEAVRGMNQTSQENMEEAIRIRKEAEKLKMDTLNMQNTGVATPIPK